jgi:hypothetical protein
MILLKTGKSILMSGFGGTDNASSPILEPFILNLVVCEPNLTQFLDPLQYDAHSDVDLLLTIRIGTIDNDK